MRPGSSCSDIQGHIPPWEWSPPHGSWRGHAWGATSEGGSSRSLQGCPGRWCHGVPKALKSEARLRGDKLSCIARQTQHTHPWDAYTRPPQECSTVWPCGGAVEKARVRLRLNSRVWADVQYFTMWLHLKLHAIWLLFNGFLQIVIVDNTTMPLSVS